MVDGTGYDVLGPGWLVEIGNKASSSNHFLILTTVPLPACDRTLRSSIGQLSTTRSVA